MTAAAAGSPAARRSLLLALAAAGLGVLLVVLGGTRAWATVTATAELAGLGSGAVARIGVAGDALGPFGALALLGLLVGLGVLVTAGRGRWPVGVLMAAMAGAQAWLAAATAGSARERVLALAVAGRIDGLPSGARLAVTTSPAGPALVWAGAALLLAAGVVTVARGRRWPAMGQAFRAPADRVTAPADLDQDGGEPPWEGD